MIGAVVAIAGGALVALTGLLGLLGRLPRNRLAGVRTRATLRSDRAFAVGNRAAGPAVMAGGVVAFVAGLLALLRPADANGIVLTGVVLMAVLAVAGGVLGNRAADRAEGGPG